MRTWAWGAFGRSSRVAIFVCACLALGGLLADTAFSAEPPAEAAAELSDEAMAPKPLDGVMIEAVESYPNPRNHHLSLGVGLYPFNAYYMGALINGAYLYQFSPNFGWEVVNVNYAYSVQNDLTTELADKYAVNPKRIKRLEFLVTSNAHLNLLNGKFVLLKNHIRYFNASGIIGLGLVKTNDDSSIAPNLGLRFSTFTSDKTAFFFDVRNTLAVPSVVNYVTFTLGLALGL